MFSPHWIRGEHSFIFLAVFQQEKEGLEIFAGAIVSHFFFFKLWRRFLSVKA